MQNEEKIWIVTSNAEAVTPTEGVRGIVTRSHDWVNETESNGRKAIEAVAVSAQRLEQNMVSFLSIIGGIFNRAEQQAKEENSGMQLDEIELSVEISAEGEIKLLGTGVKGGGKGGLTLRFKRSQFN